MRVLHCSVAGPGPRHENQTEYLDSLAPICTEGGGAEGAPKACLVYVSKSAVVLTMLKSFSSHLNSTNCRQPRQFSLSSSYAVLLEPCSWDIGWWLWSLLCGWMKLGFGKNSHMRSVQRAWVAVFAFTSQSTFFQYHPATGTELNRKAEIKVDMPLGDKVILFVNGKTVKNREIKKSLLLPSYMDSHIPAILLAK